MSRHSTYNWPDKCRTLEDYRSWLTAELQHLEADNPRNPGQESAIRAARHRFSQLAEPKFGVFHPDWLTWCRRLAVLAKMDDAAVSEVLYMMLHEGFGIIPPERVKEDNGTEQ